MNAIEGDEGKGQGYCNSFIKKCRNRDTSIEQYDDLIAL